jgi:hypothetical protein
MSSDCPTAGGRVRMGGDINQAFDYGIDAILTGLERQPG